MPGYNTVKVRWVNEFGLTVQPLYHSPQQFSIKLRLMIICGDAHSKASFSLPYVLQNIYRSWPLIHSGSAVFPYWSFRVRSGFSKSLLLQPGELIKCILPDPIDSACIGISGCLEHAWLVLEHTRVQRLLGHHGVSGIILPRHHAHLNSLSQCLQVAVQLPHSIYRTCYAVLSEVFGLKSNEIEINLWVWSIAPQ